MFEAAKEVEPNNVPKRRDAVFHPDFLALFIGSSVVGDGHLIDGDSEFGYFRSDFDLEAKSMLTIVILRIISPRNAL